MRTPAASSLITLAVMLAALCACAPPAAPPTQSSAQSLPAPPVRAEQSIPPVMVRIPGQNFEVGRYEVTFGQWDACVAAGGCNDYRPDDEGWGRGDRPVINVSLHDAQAFVQWLSQHTGQRYRLVTSAEWETAARAGRITNHWWGVRHAVCDESAHNGANFDACTDDRTRPVGSFPPNPYGLYDMHGNVAEWVDGCEDNGPDDASCSLRVFSGGSWQSDAEGIGARSGSADAPATRFSGLGFRVARTAAQPEAAPAPNAGSGGAGATAGRCCGSRDRACYARGFWKGR